MENTNTFLPTTRQEMEERGWDQLDVILVSGDTYIDSSYMGIAVIGRYLESKGYKVGIIAQPDTGSDKDIARLGEPRLFWGVTGGSVDSMVANYTALKKPRRSDDYTPGGKNNRRPNRALIVYSNLIRSHFKNTVPIVLGGIEASLRRIAHYDYWDDKIRRSILFDAKGDILVYGMGERATGELAEALDKGTDWRNIRGICYPSADPPLAEDLIELPSFDEVSADPEAFTRMFHLFYQNNDPGDASTLMQKQDTRYLIQNPPAMPLVGEELDQVYELPYQRDVHPYYRKQGEVVSIQTIRDSVATHRGCFGECNFCAIAIHQGRSIRSRSEDSIIREIKVIASSPGFKGYIRDLGGPTANMYGMDCRIGGHLKSCPPRAKRKMTCLTPRACTNLKMGHKRQRDLLRQISRIPEVTKAFVTSGVRYDLILADQEQGERYLHDLVKYHVSGQLKIAPEHTDKRVLELMGKPETTRSLISFKKKFSLINQNEELNQFLSYYFIVCHPGEGFRANHDLRRFLKQERFIRPEQVQVFTPTPSTYSTLMYYTGKDPFTGEEVFVEKLFANKDEMKKNIAKKPPGEGGREYRDRGRYSGRDNRRDDRRDDKRDDRRDDRRR